MNLPEESDIVLCTVSKVQFHSVFVTLNEFDKTTAMLHISEVAPGRIRNINDYVKEGKVIVCKVLKVNPSNGHVDVSLRRVSEAQRREKLEALKQQQKSEKIVEFVAKEAKVKADKLQQDIMKAAKGYDTLFAVFSAIAANDLTVDELKLGVRASKLLEETIRQRITPPEVEIKAKIKLESHASDGVVIIKKVLMDAVAVDPENVSITYLGAGSYALRIQGKEYDVLEETFDSISDLLEKSGCKYACNRV